MPGSRVLGRRALPESFEHLGKGARRGHRDREPPLAGLSCERRLNGVPHRHLAASLGDAPSNLGELIGVDGHPRAAVADERRLLPGQRVELARGERVIADGCLPVDGEQLAHAEPRGAGHHTRDLDGAPHTHSQAEAALARLRQLTGDDDAKARLREHRRAIAEEGPRRRGIELDRLRLGGGERVLDRRVEACRATEGLEERFLGIAKSLPERLETAALRLPDLRRREQQARIVGRLEEKAKHERVAIGLGQLEAEAGAQAIARTDGRFAPTREILHDGSFGEALRLEDALGSSEGRAPALVPGRERGALPGGFARGARCGARFGATPAHANEGVDDGVQVRAEQGVRRPHVERGTIESRHRVCGGRHAASERRDLGCVLTG